MLSISLCNCTSVCPTVYLCLYLCNGAPVPHSLPVCVRAASSPLPVCRPTWSCPSRRRAFCSHLSDLEPFTLLQCQLETSTHTGEQSEVTCDSVPLNIPWIKKGCLCSPHWGFLGYGRSLFKVLLVGLTYFVKLKFNKYKYSNGIFRGLETLQMVSFQNKTFRAPDYA